MEKRTKFSIWYVLLGIWVVLLLQDVIIGQFKAKAIPYSEFITALDSGRVTEIAITSNRVKGKMNDADGKEIEFTTVRVDSDLAQMLQKHNIRFTGVIEDKFFTNLLSWAFPLLVFIGVWYLIMRRMSPQQDFMALGKKAKVYMQGDINVSFEDVAGVDEAKEELKEVVQFLGEPGRFTVLGGRLPKGILLVGPTGTGKTLLAKAVAGESKVPFFSLSGSEFVEMFVGVGAARVRDLFAQAKERAPCIIFIDELDALGKARGISGIGGHDEREQTLNQLLVEMDGFDPTAGVILMAATNRPEILDPALLRPGRFDRHVLVDRPDKPGRRDILKVHMKNVTLSDDVDVEALAAMTPGFVGADLANLVNEAALLAARRGKDRVTMAEFEEAVERIVAGLEKKNRLINPKEREIVAYHEIGHALVALVLPGTDPVQKISIIPRGIAALGYTLQRPTEDRFLMTKGELLTRISVALGGRAAEEIVFQDVSTGAHNDLDKATDIARSMVKEYGMSEELGRVYFESRRRPLFLDVQNYPPGEREYSENTAEMIDNAIHGIIEDRYRVAKEILMERREALDEGARFLLEREQMQGSELTEIMERTDGEAPSG